MTLRRTCQTQPPEILKLFYITWALLKSESQLLGWGMCLAENEGSTSTGDILERKKVILFFALSG